MMKEAVSFMSDTLNDVLSIQKIEEGKLELQYEQFFISDVVRTVRHSLKGQIVAKGLKLVELIDKDVPPRVIGDRFRIEHVLANFVSNAVKFSPPSAAITVAVKLVKRPPDAEELPNHANVEFS